MAKFIKTFYQLQNGTDIAPAKVKQTTLDFQVGTQKNDPPAGPANLKTKVLVSGSRRQTGIIPRKCRIRFTGTAPTGYVQNSVIAIPLMNTAIYGLITGSSSTGTYLGAPVEILGKTPEYDN